MSTQATNTIKEVKTQQNSVEIVDNSTVQNIENNRGKSAIIEVVDSTKTSKSKKVQPTIVKFKKPRSQHVKKDHAPKLTVKQKKFVAGVVEGKSQTKAYSDAGYSGEGITARANASRLATNDNIQQAIENALSFHNATPEFAVGRLKQIATQDKEIGAARLASKDILELHGWRKNERPTVSLTVNQSFFGKARARPIIDQ